MSKGESNRGVINTEEKDKEKGRDHHLKIFISPRRVVPILEMELLNVIFTQGFWA